jgi:hypothetical protein
MDALSINWSYLLAQLASMLAVAGALVGAFVLGARFWRRQ